MIDHKKDLLELLRKITAYNGQESTLLVALINIIRASKNQLKIGLNEDFDDLIYWLEKYPELASGLKKYVATLLENKGILKIITEANLVHGTSFFSELWDRIVLKFLPEYSDTSSAESILSDIFYKDLDGKWVTQLPDDKCVRLVNLLGVKGLYEKDITSRVIQEILYSIRVLSLRISGYALNEGITKLVPEYDQHENPFIALQTELSVYINDIDSNNAERSEDDINYKQSIILLEQCKDYIQKAYNNIPKKGISFKVHQQLMMVELMLERLESVMDFIVIKQQRSSEETFITFVKSLISFISGKSKISGYINKSTQMYAREITRSIAINGEQYITKTREEYWKMFRTALGGGGIVAVACMVKMYLGSVDSSLLMKALMYSMNYCIAFIAIYLFHFTLATKQPAMTAATLAKNISEDHKGSFGYENLAKLVSQVWRTQFIAFVGNIFMAFPLTLALIVSWVYLFDENPASYKAHILIGELNIFTSPAILHAAIAGVFLFISGLIAGNISNRNKVKYIPQRIVDHPVLKQITTINFRNRVAGFVDYYWAGIVSNFWFGVFMGSISSVGVIIGLDLDIRHITFAVGNFAIGLIGYDFQMSGFDIFHSILGIVVIGFVNFSVSFALSLALALRSRGITLSALGDVIISIKQTFYKNPLSFFYPPAQEQ